SIDVTFHQESQEELVSENIKEAQEQDDQKNSGKSEIIEQLDSIPVEPSKEKSIISDVESINLAMEEVLLKDFQE
ncbi:MAG: hypothetical protein ACI86H_002032, partial [bacterium]